MFVRGRQGIENLTQLMTTLREHDLTIRVHAQILYEIQAILAEIRGVEKEIEKLDSVFNVFASQKRNKDKTRVRKLLNARIENLLVKLERIAQSNAQSA
jgi:hypothetical protein